MYVELAPVHAGHSRVTVFVDDFDAFLADASARGLEPPVR